METTIGTFELQIDEKPNGITIRLNNEEKCVLRICGIPKKVVFCGAEIKDYIDITYPSKVTESLSKPLTFGEISNGEKFVDFPTDGDDNGHGGYKSGAYIFVKTDKDHARRISDWVESSFPETMQIYKVIF